MEVLAVQGIYNHRRVRRLLGFMSPFQPSHHPLTTRAEIEGTKRNVRRKGVRERGIKKILHIRQPAQNVEDRMIVEARPHKSPPD